MLLWEDVEEAWATVLLDVDDRAGRLLALVGATIVEDLWTVASASPVSVGAFAAALPCSFTPIEASNSFQVADAFFTEVEAVVAELCTETEETFDVCVASQTVSVLCAEIRS